jgi:hypothetical protein
VTALPGLADWARQVWLAALDSSNADTVHGHLALRAQRGSFWWCAGAEWLTFSLLITAIPLVTRQRLAVSRKPPTGLTPRCFSSSLGCDLDGNRAVLIAHNLNAREAVRFALEQTACDFELI